MPSTPPLTQFVLRKRGKRRGKERVFCSQKDSVNSFGVGVKCRYQGVVAAFLRESYLRLLLLLP